MSEVRPFTRDDIVEVADLFAEVFLFDQPTDFADLRSHFEAIYFDSPFRDDDFPCLVYCGADGRINAFLGILPRPMRFRGEPIKTAIAGNLMIKGARGGPHAVAKRTASHGHQLAPAALVKAFFRFPYDLALTDSAVDASRRIWERSGGHTLRLYSFRWLCVLKPISFGLDVLERRGRFGPLARFAGPFGNLLDITTRPIVSTARPRMPDGCTIDPLEIDEMIDQFEKNRVHDLVPSYSPKSLNWILTMAKARRHHGELRTLCVRDAGGRCLGWAIYTADPGSVGQVLQLYAAPKTIERVFDCLLADAATCGVSALGGKADPLFVDHFSKARCHLRVRSWALAHARRPELLQPFFTGKALFTELEGEGWTRLLGASPKREFEPLKGAA